MQESLTDYLSKNRIARHIFDIVPGGELVDHEGKPLIFKMRALTNDEMDDILIRNGTDPSGLSVKESLSVATEIFLTACIDPNFNAVSFQDNYGVHSARELIGKFFCGMELKNIVSQYMEKLEGKEGSENLYIRAKNS